MTVDLLGLAGYLVFFLVIALNYSLVCLGLNLQWGVTGLFNVGVAGFFAIGAYATAILTGPDYANSLGGFGLPVPVGWLGSLLFAGLAALIVGVPTLRLRHDYLAISTFGIAIVIQLINETRTYDLVYVLTRGGPGIGKPDLSGSEPKIGHRLCAIR